MAKEIGGHSDAASDKKLFSSMLKKAMPNKKVVKHLKHDVKEGKKAIREDKGLMESFKKGKG